MTEITVLTGGSNAERDVALAGAAQVAAALRGKHGQVAVVDTVYGALSADQEAKYLLPDVGTQPPDSDQLAQYSDSEIPSERLVTIPEIASAELVFLVLHGESGEGGDLQQVLDARDIDYTGSGPAGSRTAMDKDAAKQLFLKASIPTAKWLMWPATESDLEEIGYPAVVKPSKVGSTLGLTVVQSWEEVGKAAAEALVYDDEVLVEQFVPGSELTAGVLGDQALAVGEIIPCHEIFDYECKYTPGMSEEIFPARIEKQLEDRVRDLALRAHEALDLRDFSRVDFRLDANGDPLCLEVNTLPGLTRTSLMPQSAAAQRISFSGLCDTICNLALKRAASRNKAGAR